MRMQRIAFCMDRKNGDGCVAAFLGRILKAAGYTTACLVGTGKKREHLRISCRAVSRKMWESLGEEPAQTSTKKKLELLEQKNPQILLWIGEGEEWEKIPKEDTAWKIFWENQWIVQSGKVWHGVRKQRFDYLGPGKLIKNVELDMPGDWQVENTATAIALAYAISLEIPGTGIDEKKIRKGIANTHCEGCLEQLRNRPSIWMDRAASPKAAELLWNSVKRIAGNRPVIGILGLERKEETAEFLKEFCPPAQILFTMSTEKGYGAYELAEMVRGFRANVTAVDSPEEALEIARLFAGEGQTTASEMPLLLIVCPRELQEKMRKVISDWKMPHSWPHQKL